MKDKNRRRDIEAPKNCISLPKVMSLRMKKTPYLTRLLLLLLVSLCNPTLGFESQDTAPYTLKLDGAGNQRIVESVSDDDGNLYLVGYFEDAGNDQESPALSLYENVNGGSERILSAGGVEGAEPYTLAGKNIGGRDLFVAKIDWQGSLVWLKTAGGQGHDVATGIVYDRRSEKLFVSGFFHNVASFDLQDLNAVKANVGLQQNDTSNLFIATLDPVSGEWLDQQAMPISASITNNIKLKGLRLGSDDNSLGNGMVVAANTDNTESEIALYLKGQVLNSSALKPTSTPGNGQVWSADIGLQGQDKNDLALFYRKDDGDVGTTSAGDWAFVVRLDYIDEPNTLVGESRWNWRWLKRLDTQAPEPANVGVETLSLESCEGQPLGSMLASSSLGEATYSRELNSEDIGWNSDHEGVHIGTYIKRHYNFEDPLPAGAKIVSVSITTETYLDVETNGINFRMNNKFLGWREARDANAARTLHFTYGKEVPGYKYGKVNTLTFENRWRHSYLRNFKITFHYYLGDANKKPETCYQQSLGAMSVNPNDGLESDVYFAGQFRGAVALNASTAIVSEAGQHNGFVGAVKSNGDLKFFSTVSDTSSLNDLIFDEDEQSLLTLGHVKPVLANGADVHLDSFNSNHDINILPQWNNDNAAKMLLAKFDTNGKWLWADASQSGYGRHLAKSRDGNHVLSGYENSENVLDVTQGDTQESSKIINISGKNIDSQNKWIEQEFAAGSYRIKPISKWNGGQYTEWRRWNSTNCTLRNGCFTGKGWEHSYVVHSPQIQQVVGAELDVQKQRFHLSKENKLVFPAVPAHVIDEFPGFAFLYAKLSAFTLSDDSVVKFAVSDGNTKDNHGGVSLKVTRIEEESKLFGRRPVLVGFSEKPDGNGVEVHWRKEGTAESSFAYGDALTINNLNTLYFIGSSLSGHDQSFDLTERDNSAADTITSEGSILNVLDPASGRFLPEFQNYKEFTVGQRIDPPLDGVSGQSSLALRKSWINTTDSSVDIGFDTPLSSGGELPINKALLTVNTSFDVYAAGPLERAVLLWPTDNNTANVYAPVSGHAVKVRWPEVAEGLQEYIYSTENDVNVLPVELNGGEQEGTANEFAWLHYAAEVKEDGLGAAVNTNVTAVGGQLYASAPRMASLVFFAEGDSLREQPSILSTRSYPWDHDNKYLPDIPVDIGKVLINPVSEGDAGGYVMTELARYDTGNSKSNRLIYDRNAHKGQIFPVNKNGEGDSSGNGVDDGRHDDLYVAWYQLGGQGLDWPVLARGYLPEWPSDAGVIALTSTLGSKGLRNGAEQSRTGLSQGNNAPLVYFQNDRSQPGYNPNEEHAFIDPYQGDDAVVHALRTDLNNYPQGNTTSEPYVLVRYQKTTDETGGSHQDENEDEYAYRVYQVVFNNDDYPDFSLATITAGEQIAIPEYFDHYISSLTSHDDNGEAFWQDHTNALWSRSGDAALEINYAYNISLEDGFWLDLDGDGNADEATETAWLDVKRCEQAQAQDPEDDCSGLSSYTLTYETQWPDAIPQLAIGDTLFGARNGLPDVYNAIDLRVLYDSNDPFDEEERASTERMNKATVRLFNSSAEVRLFAGKLPTNPNGPNYQFYASADNNGPVVVIEQVNNAGQVIADIRLPARISSEVEGVQEYDFPDLPSDLRYRLRFKPLPNNDSYFYFLGGKFSPQSGQSDVDSDFHMLNVLGADEKAKLQRLDNSGAFPFNNVTDEEITPWDAIVEALYIKSRNPHLLDLDANGQADDGLYIGMEPVTTTDAEGNTQIVMENGKPLLQHTTVTGAGALTAAFAQQPGRVVLGTNIDEDSSGDVELLVVDIVQPVGQGHINVFHNELNKLDRQLILRQALDLGGRSDDMVFEWYWHPDVGEPPAIADIPLNNDGSPKSTYDDAGKNTGWRKLVGDSAAIVLDGGLPLMADGWLLSRYKLADDTQVDSPYYDWTELAGETLVPGQATQPMRIQGWIKRVMSSINAFEQRYSDFHNENVNSYTSMLVQAGPAYQGDVALNQEDDNLNSLGLIELYQTLLNEARRLSIDADVPITGESAVYNQLLFAASRIASLYNLIGNEAFSDAMDPTVGVLDNGGNPSSLPPTRFAFENQMASLLDEELALLRGVDDNNAATGNRLLWNFTGGDGEPTYVQVYGLADSDGDGKLDDEARTQYPQGHGDAWGHYLTATKLYYSLVRHPNYDWTPLTDSANVLGVNVTVDYRDEELFVKSAAAKARTGARIVDLVFRKEYSHAPAGRWQGYKDPQTERAWGMDDWARRTGQGIVMDWALANALLPYEDLEAEDDIARLDRQSVHNLPELSAVMQEIEGIVSNADRGNNPVGLASDAIPFDISANRLLAGESHFEQVYLRALSAANNANDLFEYANQLSQQIRGKQLSDQEFELQEAAKERDFKSRMIEIFGTPYQGNIGPGKLYPSGYSGPDMYQFQYIDSDLPSLPASQLETLRLTLDVNSGKVVDNLFFPGDVNDLGDLDDHFDTDDHVTLEFPTSTSGYPFVKPDASWASRATPGDIQLQLGELQLIDAKLNTAKAEQQALMVNIQAEVDLLEAIYNIRAEDVRVYNGLIATNVALSTALGGVRAAAQVTQITNDESYKMADIWKNTGSEAVGFSNDTALVTDTLMAQSYLAFLSGVTRAIKLQITQNAILQPAVDALTYSKSITTKKDDFPIEIQRQLTVIENLMNEEAKIRYSIVELLQEAENARTVYQQLVSEGFRIWGERTAFRKEVASRTTTRRYEDMTYRVFRNDALQKYRASFDLATKYTYLAAKAFDYETGLLSDDTDVDQRFYEELIRQRGLGQFSNGEPVANVQGLSAPLAAMRDGYAAAGGLFGNVDPLAQQFDFSLRKEAFRILNGEAGRTRWQELLQNARVANLWDLPEFSQFMVPPGNSQDSDLPGIVLRFGSMIDIDRNFFGWPKGAGDTTYPSSYSATKLYRVGLHFDNFPELEDGSPALSTAYAYLVPVGTDFLRSPTDIDQLRSYQVLDQYIPAPTNLIASATNNDEIWLPTNGQDWTQRRRMSELEVSTGEVFDFSAVNSSSRLVGRSVWNTEWLLVIPGYSLLGNDNLGLDILINGEPSNTLDKGISDIRLVFETYSIAAQ